MLIKIKIIAKNRSKINQTSKYQHRNSTIIEMTVIVIRAVVSISSSVSVGFWLKTVVHGIGCARFRLFFIQKMSIALHITFTENNQTYYFVSNHTPGGQHFYVRLYTGSLCNAEIGRAHV